MKLIFALLALSCSLSAFAQNVPSASKDEEQIKADFKARQDLLQPYVGIYSGTFTNPSGSVVAVQLLLAQSTAEVKTEGGAAQPVADLTGSLHICFPDSSGSAAACTSYGILSTITSAVPDNSTQPAHLILSGTLPFTVENKTPVAATYNLNVEGKNLSGTLTSSGIILGSLQLIKIN